MATDVMGEMRVAFRAEAMDLLIELDSALLELEGAPLDSALVNRVFRAIHTIKGSGGTAGFAHLAKFAHNMEEAFDLARGGRLAVTPELIDCGLKACDVARLIIEEVTGEAVVAGELEVTGLFKLLLPASEPPPVERDDQSKRAPARRRAFEVVFKPNREMFYSGADPVTLLDDLRELGPAHITAHADQVPSLTSLEAELCYLWWEILLVTDRDEEAIKEVFIFVEECDLRIHLREDQAAIVALFDSVPADSFDLFILECEDHLEGIERAALALEKDPASRENLDSLFRAVHSIKGNAGLLLGQVKGAALAASHPLQLLMRIAHGLESLLDPFRGPSAGALTEGMVQTALETCDAVRLLLHSLRHSEAEGSPSPELLERLGIRTNPAPSDPHVDGREAAFLNTTSQCVEMIAGCLRRIEDDGAANGTVLATYQRGLTTLSAAAQYRKSVELQEPLAQQLRILDAAMKPGAALGGEERSALGRIFQNMCSILERMAPRSEVSNITAPTAAPLPTKVPAQPSDTSASSATIRIDRDKLDRLMRVVGELLVARGIFPLLVQKLNNGASGSTLLKDLKEAGSGISRIADELQTSVMSIRMLPVKTVFQRFPRLVRDLARTLGKEIRLIIEGEEIELDKTILEQISDPLVHVIRNAVDHGLEPAEERRANGKDATGQMILRASRDAAGIMIEVTDDGRGLDTNALKLKAVQKGLLTPETAAAMTEEAAFQLVFLPGLTTARKVTDVSGRGVGMDVVRSNVRNLQGSIEIRSKVGQGTTFLMKLPTSLMISKGILLEAGSNEYVLPLNNIRDMVKMLPQQAHEYRGRTLLQVRGITYSVFNLARMLGLVPATRTQELSVAIVEAGEVKYGLVVDKFLTEVEVLVKPLSGELEQCKEFQGAAIMGDGRVVLVLNALECHSLDRTICS